jgi:lipid-A-disaccharide synthase
MRIFLSAGEPSGDVHGSNLIRALRRLRPEVEVYGFGGEEMEAAGCRLLYPLCRLSVMWLVRVLANLHKFLGVLSLADRTFRQRRPDAVVLIDYPGLHWWLARSARHHGIPVFYFVPPQIWAWAGWRVHKMRRLVDHVLCTLPFELDWYRQRGVPASYVGHPYFDAVRSRPLDADFLAEQRRRGGRLVALLPGSRNQEVASNLPTLLRTAERVRQAVPEARFLAACYRPEHRRRVLAAVRGSGLPLEAHVGRTPEIIHAAEAAAAVSGSVSLELLHHGTPAVITYRVGSLMYALGRRLIQVNSITLVNLLAGRTIFPEYVSTGCSAPELAGHLIRWLNDATAREQVVAELAALRKQVGQPGACDRAARYILEALSHRQRLAA